jgi:hypothetical protein
MADMQRSLVSTYGCVSCNIALENSLGTADAHRRKDRCMRRHESGNIVISVTLL